MKLFKRKQLNVDDNGLLTMANVKRIIQDLTFSWELLNSKIYEPPDYGVNYNFFLNEVGPCFAEYMTDRDKQKIKSLTIEISELEKETSNLIALTSYKIERATTNGYMPRHDVELLKKEIQANAIRKAKTLSDKTRKTILSYIKTVQPFLEEFNAKVELYYPNGFGIQRDARKAITQTDRRVLNDINRDGVRLLFNGELRELNTFPSLNTYEPELSNWKHYTMIGEQIQYGTFSDKLIEEYVNEIARQVDYYPDPHDRYNFVKRNLERSGQVSDFDAFLRERYEEKAYTQQLKECKLNYFNKLVDEANPKPYEQYIKEVKEDIINAKLEC